MTTTQEITIGLLDSRAGDGFRAHRAGCRDINLGRREQLQNQWTITADTYEDVAEDACVDFIAEGSMTLEDALGYVSFAPCCKLRDR
jgi:hypothetical protein